MSSWWDQIRYQAVREGWNTVLASWIVFTFAIIGVWQALKWAFALVWWVSGQTPPNELLDG